MIIQKASKSDIGTIKNFQIKMAKESEGMILDDKIIAKGVKAVFEDKSKGIYYVAEENNTIIASLLTTFEWSDWRNSCVLWIQSVYVIPEYRKQGVFKKMYQHLKEIVNNSEEYIGLRLYVDKSNFNAQKVYDKVGMNNQHYIMYEWFKE
ncbi:MAG: GNAT family N-acetyltransferase [Bacteroidales bacterium]|nr:GNAT family N-acetyltransferase [Bacteroidales bacterium]MBN2755672.1 GNAT family N-acetyltransferase [Bacteroidales bacterium]